MDDQSKAIIKDQFLAYALMRAEYFIPSDFLIEFSDLQITDDQLLDLINEIISFDSDFIDVLNGNGMEIFMIIAKTKAEKFLNVGGFAEDYQLEENEWKVLFHTLFIRWQGVDKRPASSEDQQMLYVKKDFTYLLFVLMALFGFLYAVYDLLFG